ncbi:SRPBCC family protein [Kineosporia rhizophila]|uniref:SRPBCC family protein n=1 Tax=Kineosporia TaxID=49184 RepID=UPI000A66566F|nr:MULTISPECIES: SRPBCC family protein [Kineosporia]MCE0539319.1 SRPBCC family protein [Kineosporia rhizophila]GLY18524.1 activator of HSP90 ATPase [Kineosporia sp. NBRC 101677]
MSERSVQHDTFVIEKIYPARPERVYFALSDQKAKKAWFSHAASEVIEEVWDFRVGGTEVNAGRTGDMEHRFVATYHDIVENERIVYSYEMYVNGVKLSVSQTTIEIRPDDAGARLVFTEYGAFLDGHDNVKDREHGTGELLELLGSSLSDS